MKRIFAAAVLTSILSFAFLAGAYAARYRPANPKTYQVTGPVVELTNDMIVVMKGRERWEIVREASTKVTGDLKVGATATIQYRMSAAAIDVKPSKKP